MRFETVADVYAENDRIRSRLIEIVGGLGAERSAHKTADGKWTIQGIVEHLEKVEKGMMRISAKLLLKAEEEGRTSNGLIKISSGFLERISNLGDEKFEAPDVVQPGGDQTIAESLRKMNDSRKKLHALKEKFESVEGTELVFPHPIFGNLTAHDWLVLIGGHEALHTRQIERVLSNSR